MKKLNLSGIYDKRTITKATELGVSDFTFDFRPMSFNFIQQYVLDEILDGLESGLQNINLHFENEADFMVKNLANAVSDKGHICKLIFSDVNKAKYYDQFGKEYLNYYHDNLDIRDILSSTLNKGIIFKYNFLHELMLKGTLDSFMNNFYSLSMSVSKKIKKVVVELDWDSNIASSLLDTIDCDLFTISINSKIEVCYRNVDNSKFEDQMNFIQRQTC